ncbi:MAG TPA: hypothetical protein DCG52_05055 [Alphaproteobacteria bacterium]|nr:hypothetical protein [Alphaproteobacteria bacterium]
MSKKKKFHVIKNIVTSDYYEVFPEEDFAKMKKKERKFWLKYEKSLEGATIIKYKGHYSFDRAKNYNPPDWLTESTLAEVDETVSTAIAKSLHTMDDILDELGEKND